MSMITRIRLEANGQTEEEVFEELKKVIPAFGQLIPQGTDFDLRIQTMTSDKGWWGYAWYTFDVPEIFQGPVPDDQG
jgi:hypothetical protein